MPNTLIALVAFLWPLAAAWIIFRLFPTTISKFVEKEIERRSDSKLERIKAELQGSYSTLRSSVDVLLASNSGVRPHIIDSVATLWSNIVAMREHCGGLLVFDSLFLPEEAQHAFSNRQDPQEQRILAFVSRHEDELSITDSPFFGADLERHRLFSGDRAWLIFYAIRAVLGRAALLVSRSFKDGKFHDWRDDDPMHQLMGLVVPSEAIAEARMPSIGGLSKVLTRMEAEFLHEATRVMSGSKAMADSLADVQRIMLLQNAEIAAKKSIQP